MCASMRKTWKIIDTYTPQVVRCLARRKTGTKQVKAISDNEIAIASTLDLKRVQEIYNSRTWDNISVWEMRAFCLGCNFDPLNTQDANRARAYIGQKCTPKWAYLKKSPWWDDIFEPLLRDIRQQYVPENPA